jgi:hypothetical protein
MSERPDVKPMTAEEERDFHTEHAASPAIERIWATLDAVRAERDEARTAAEHNMYIGQRADSRVKELEAEVARILNAPDYDSACDMGKLLDYSREALARAEARCGVLTAALEGLLAALERVQIEGTAGPDEFKAGHPAFDLGYAECSAREALTGSGAAAARLLILPPAPVEAPDAVSEPGEKAENGSSGPDVFPPARTMTLKEELEHAINRHSAENGSNTPDFILAEYLMAALAAFDAATVARGKWFGRGTP